MILDPSMPEYVLPLLGAFTKRDYEKSSSRRAEPGSGFNAWSSAVTSIDVLEILAPIWLARADIARRLRQHIRGS